MSKDEALKLLEKAVVRSSQAAVAREMGYSAATINQVLARKYKGDTTEFLRCVVEMYGSETVQCPVLGNIALKRCSAERKRPFAMTNPNRVRLWRACRECEVRK